MYNATIYTYTRVNVGKCANFHAGAATDSVLSAIPIFRWSVENGTVAERADRTFFYIHMRLEIEERDCVFVVVCGGHQVMFEIRWWFST